MKVAPRDIDRFISRPSETARAILLFGPDLGLSRRRAQMLTSTWLGETPDPLQLTTMTGAAVRADPARLTDELNAIPMFGDLRVVRLEDAEDNCAKTIAAAMDGIGPESRLIVLSAELNTRSSLRKLFEAHAQAAAIPAYAPDGAALRNAIAARLNEAGAPGDRDAIEFLATRAGEDFGVVIQEAEKVALHALANGRTTLRDAALCAGDAAILGSDAAALAIADGRSDIANAALDRLLRDGAAPIALVRGFARHFDRLQSVVIASANGATLDTAIGSLRPPVFFKMKARFTAQARRFDAAGGRGAIAEILADLRRCEAEMKHSETPPHARLRAAVTEWAGWAQGVAR